MQNKPRLFFLGTPDFAVPALRLLHESGRFEIALVITQPDKPAGRGHELTPPPIKTVAEGYSIPVFQPPSLKGLSLTAQGQITGPEALSELLESLNSGPFAAGIAIAYGKIIPPALISLPRSGIINIHPSKLPRWRGAAPLQRALFAGDEETAIALMAIDEGLDTGGIYWSEPHPIHPDDDYGQLAARVAQRGAELLLEHLPSILSGALPAKPQVDLGATYAEKWEKEENQIRWSEPAAVTLRRIRTASPDPGARTSFEDQPVKIYRARPATSAKRNLEPGTIAEVSRSELVVAAGHDEYIALEELQFPGRKRLPVADIVRGKKFEPGMVFR